MYDHNSGSWADMDLKITGLCHELTCAKQETERGRERGRESERAREID